MKNIKLYNADKYRKKEYTLISSGVYRKDNAFYISISFEQEHDLGEGKNAADISQYPIEDVLDKFNVHVSDFYKKLNIKENKCCYIEFSSASKDNIENLRGILGKHVYNKNVMQDGEELVDLIIE